MKAACGPPFPIGTPKRWLLPTTTSAPCAPGLSRSTAASGSVATTNYIVNGTLVGGVTASESVNTLKLTDAGTPGSLNIATGQMLSLASGAMLSDTDPAGHPLPA